NDSCADLPRHLVAGAVSLGDDQPHQQRDAAGDDHFVEVKTLPSFISNATASSALMSRSGLPFTPTMSAYAPGAITPSWPVMSRRSAAREVADLMASIGDMPKPVIRPNSC